MKGLLNRIKKNTPIVQDNSAKTILDLYFKLKAICKYRFYFICNMRYIILLVIINCFLAPNLKGQIPPTLDHIRPAAVDNVIKNTVDKYKNLSHYLDSGKVVIAMYDGPYPNSTAKIFKTVYDANGLFNYEFYNVGSSSSLYIINRDASNIVKSWWGINNTFKTYNTLEHALEHAKGVSALTSTLIPTLLLGKNINTSKNIFDNLMKSKFEGTEIINGKTCYKISGVYKSVFDIEFWIDKDVFLIRKIISETSIKNYKVRSTYNFFPDSSSSINRKSFEFRPHRQIEL